MEVDDPVQCRADFDLANVGEVLACDPDGGGEIEQERVVSAEGHFHDASFRQDCQRLVEAAVCRGQACSEELAVAVVSPDEQTVAISVKATYQ